MAYTESRAKRRVKNEGGTGALDTVKSSFMGCGAAIVVALLLWFVSAAVAYANADPDTFVGTFGLATSYISAIAAGFVSVRINKRNALVCGLMSGTAFALLLFLVSRFFDESYSSGYSLPISIALRASTLLMSVLGAFIGIHKKSKPRRRR